MNETNYISRGRIEAYNKCPRRYLYAYKYKGGWEVKSPNMDLTIGIAVHKGMEQLTKDSNVELAVSLAHMEFDGITSKWKADIDADPLLASQVEEGRALTEGLIRGWFHSWHAAFMEEYEIISSEEEIEALLAPNIVLVARTDAVLRNRRTGTIYVLNWKTTQEKSDWNTTWQYDIQMVTEALAVEGKLGIKIGGCIVVGLYKGQRREGSFTSKLLWGYKKQLPDGTWEYRSSYVKGWVKFKTWREAFPFGHGIAAWIAFQNPAELREEFMISEPVLKNEAKAEAWLRQIVRRESDIQHITAPGVPEQDQLDFFEQKFSKWNCRGCSFKEVCDMQTTMDSLIEAGRFQVRESPLRNRGETMP